MSIPAKYIKNGVTIDGVTGTLKGSECCLFTITGAATSIFIKSDLVKECKVSSSGTGWTKRNTSTRITFNGDGYIFGFIFTNYPGSTGGPVESITVSNPNFGMRTPVAKENEVFPMNNENGFTLFSCEVNKDTVINIPTCGPSVTLGNYFGVYPSFIFLFQIQ